MEKAADARSWVVASPLRAHYATWLGWLLSADTPIMIVPNPDKHPADIRWPALNVGCALTGELIGGIAAGMASGRDLRTTPLASPSTGDALVVVEVRHAGGQGVPGRAVRSRSGGVV